MVNTRMFVFKHPKYYKELRERNKSDQVISKSSHDGESERAPGPGLKQQAASAKLQSPSDSNNKPQASSSKQQASSFRTNLSKQQAASFKPQATSVKLKATSFKLQDSRATKKFHGP